MAHKTLVNGTAYDVKGGKVLVNGTGYDIKNGKTLVNGTGYTVGFSVPINSLEIGTSVYMNVNGVRTEFLVVNKGIPQSSSLYDSSCDGVWLLMKDCYTTMKYQTSGSSSNYKTSAINSYLSTTFLGFLDSGMQTTIKEVKVSYLDTSTYDSEHSATLRTGSDGMSAKVFILSAREVGSGDKTYGYTATSKNIMEDGATLDYFSDLGSGNPTTKRVAYLNGEPIEWHTRTAMAPSSPFVVICVDSTGAISLNYGSGIYGVRPAMIVPFDVKVDSSMNIVV